MRSVNRGLLPRLAAATLLLVIAASPASAQRPILRGTVIDSATNAPLRGARVEAVSGATTMVAFTDERGRFAMVMRDSLSAALAVTRIGYAPRRLARVTVLVHEPRPDIALVALGIPLDPIVVTASRRGALALATPAAVSVVDREHIEERAALGVIEHVRTTPGMDLASKGLIQHAYAVRGARGSVSGALLTLTDFRSAEVPSLALNIPYLLAPTSDDIDRIEIVRGPGAALYGPGADRGVLQFITRSPFESVGAAVTLTGGARSLFGTTVRWAGLLGRHAAIKLSGDYLRGTDWPYTDSAEAAKRTAALLTGADPDTLRIGRRASGLARSGAEARLDWRPTAHTEVVTTAGFADAIRVVELGGDVGSVQAQHWHYRFVQARLRDGRLHANVFYNLSNTGDSYLLQTGGRVVDSSRVLAAQLQHGATLGPLDLLYGADARWTDPRTGGTIDGENEDRDRMTEIGAYLVGEAALGARTDLTAALRADHHSRLSDYVLSPRVGLVFRPSAAHALRVTFNRGFTSPDANTLSLDIPQGTLPGTPYLVRASSVPRSGYTFRRDCGGLCMASPFAAPGAEPIDATSVWAALFPGIPAPAAGQIGTYLAALDLETKTFNPVTPAEVADVAPHRRTITSTVEVGWKAAFGRRFGLTADLFLSRVSDVLGSRYTATPNAFLDYASLAAYLANFMPVAQANAAAAQVAQLPVGTVSPQETSHPTDLLVLTRQGGAYTLWGLDIGFDLPLKRNLTTRGSASWLSRDSATVSSVPGAFVLGVPRRKGAIGFRWHDPRRGHDVGLDARWVAGFPVHTGVYIGRVNGYGVLDLHLTLALPVGQHTTLTFQANNALDRRHQEFVGAPALGRLLLTRLRTEL
jgi:iron complex outermembrane receptor protein